MAVYLPRRIEMRRFGGDADVVDELWNDLDIPLAGDAFGGRGGQHDVFREN